MFFSIWDVFVREYGWDEQSQWQSLLIDNLCEVCVVLECGV